MEYNLYMEVNKIYKRNIEDILFSNIKKRTEKISKWFFSIVFLQTILSLFLLQFASNGDILDQVWFGVSFFYSLLFMSTGFKWYSKMEMSNTGQKKWFIVMTSLGVIQLPLKFLLSMKGIGLFLIPLLMYVIVYIVRTTLNAKNTPNNLKWYFKYINTIIFLIIGIMLPIGIMLMTKTISFSSEDSTGDVVIAFMSIFTIMLIGLVILKKIIRKKNAKLFLLDSSLIAIFLFSLISGVDVWIIEVLIMHFHFAFIPIIVGILQIGMSVIVYFLMKKNNNEFESHFVKSFIFNLGIVIEITLVIFSKQMQSFLYRELESYYLNIITMSISVTILIFAYIKNNITRRKIYKIFDSLGITIMVGIIIAMSILENFGILSGLSLTKIDEILLYVPLTFISLNVLISLFDWILSTTNNNKEKIWK